MFEEMAKLESMDYTIRQIRAMVAEGTDVDVALASMETERISRLHGLAQRMTSAGAMLEFSAQFAARAKEELRDLTAQGKPLAPEDDDVGC